MTMEGQTMPQGFALGLVGLGVLYWSLAVLTYASAFFS